MASLPLLAETAAAWGMSLSDSQHQQFATYAAELQQWNTRINLTSITSLDDIVVRHLLDSLVCALHWGNPPTALLDVGSGAGFPGVPLKIWRPSLKLTLVESVGKKARFLQHMVDLLGLTDVTILHDRVEAVGQDRQQRERYDVVTARAVAELRVLVEYCLPLARVGGRVLAPKGSRIDEELVNAQRAIELLGGAVHAVLPVRLPRLAPRMLVVLHKRFTTPLHYPRAAGVPTRRPL